MDVIKKLRNRLANDHLIEMTVEEVRQELMRQAGQDLEAAFWLAWNSLESDDWLDSFLRYREAPVK